MTVHSVYSVFKVIHHRTLNGFYSEHSVLLLIFHCMGSLFYALDHTFSLKSSDARNLNIHFGHKNVVLASIDLLIQCFSKVSFKTSLVFHSIYIYISICYFLLFKYQYPTNVTAFAYHQFYLNLFTKNFVEFILLGKMIAIYSHSLYR